ncbi:ankyrin repeat domain-containing protein [Erwinia rhapontici]|uniref:ankyrin repeat domain-containing protein n=1 Tax=Erwinia rhapontici TaxID=55212 RepID=UPI0013319FF4|nr:ankyrin repeat domain-containing protein [Erwinia rhapontici]MBP2154602.1 ankyrin repeat protein [Erwinia rhapontici]
MSFAHPDFSTSNDTLQARFLRAAQQGEQDILQQCRDQGVDLNVTTAQRTSAITLAAQHQHYACVAWLIEAGADINQQDDTCLNPFLLACLNNDLTLLRLLLPAAPDLTRVTRFGGIGLTPASEKGHVEIVRELLSRTTINVNHTNFLGWTPLLEAILLNDGGAKQQETVQLLLDNGASPHLTDKYGKTPLQLARSLGYDAIAIQLIHAGARDE